MPKKGPLETSISFWAGGITWFSNSNSVIIKQNLRSEIHLMEIWITLAFQSIITALNMSSRYIACLFIMMWDINALDLNIWIKLSRLSFEETTVLYVHNKLILQWQSIMGQVMTISITLSKPIYGY